jgi:16S rRNA (guanine966-N2)-methyltransferase
MRVIAGQYKNRQLATVEGLSVRPTSNKVKTGVFNILYSLGQPLTSFADVFAGSGGMGIEALSRGASQVTFYEKDPQAAAALKRNLAHVGIATKQAVVLKDALSPLTGRPPFDVIYIDPPYAQGLALKAVQAFLAARAIARSTVVIVETAFNEDLVLPPELICYDTRRYGRTKLQFLRLKE